MGAHRSLLGKFVFELVIVFVGVTAAFSLESWRQERQRREDVQAIYEALSDEIRLPAVSVGPVINADIDRKLAAWNSSRNKGERPPLVYMQLRGSTRPPTGVWQAALASGAIGKADPHLIFCLARFYNRLEDLGDSWAKYDQFTSTEVLPHLGEPSFFYDHEDRLKPQYAAHVERLRAWRKRSGEMTEYARSLLALLHNNGVGRCPSGAPSSTR